MRTRPVLVLLAVLLLAADGRFETPAAPPAEPAVVFLVRHAEKLDDSNDPPLSEQGQARAAALARLLADAGITRVFSTGYARTRLTAQPLADRLGAEVEIYDPRDPAALVRRLADAGGRALVVGHSNTTPGLVQALGGDPGGPIAEDEYDRLYVVTLTPGAPPETVLLRYEAP